MKKLALSLMQKAWLRIALAALILIAGLLPVGSLTLTDDSFVDALTATLRPAPNAASYPWDYRADYQGRVLRSEDGGKNWREIGNIPEGAVQIEKSGAAERVVLARGKTALWRSDNGGVSWVATTSLPSRPTALAVAHQSTGLVYAGTESMGAYRSDDGGQSWQPLSAPAAGGPAALAISALAVSATDDRIVYAATGYWLGTSQARFTPEATYLSPDGGKQWFEMSRAALGAEPISGLATVAGRPLAAVEITQAGKTPVELHPTADMLVGLYDPEPARRAATAAVLGLSGDRVYAAALLASLSDPDFMAGKAAAEALGRLADPAAILPLLAALHDGDDLTRGRAASVLGQMQVETAVPELSAMLRSGGSSLRQPAAEALAAIGTPAALQALLGPLADDEMTPARQAAMRGLELAGEPAVTLLTEALRQADPVLRRNAAEMLGGLASAQSAPALTKALSDGDPTVRSQAAWALSEIGTETALRALRQAAAREQEPAAGQAMQTALARAEQAGRANATVAATPWQALLKVLAQAPANAWSVLVLALVLVILLVGVGPRLLPPAERKGRSTQAQAHSLHPTR